MSIKRGKMQKTDVEDNVTPSGIDIGIYTGTSGTLVIIVFGYPVKNYETPTVQEDHPKTFLQHAPDSNPLNIPLKGQTELLLQTVG